MIISEAETIRMSFFSGKSNLLKYSIKYIK